MKRWLKRLIISAAAAGALYGSAVMAVKASRYVLANTVDKNVQEYVENNLENIIKAQEEKLGITYVQRPKVEFELPSEKRSFSWEGEYFLGLYKAEENTIYINSGFHLAPFPDIGDFISYILTVGYMGNINNTINHELGHFYCDQLSEAVGLGNWPKKERAASIEELIGFKIVAEGIAQYFEVTMNPQEDLFEDRYWPSSIGGFLDENGEVNSIFCYQGGYHLVKPIIDQYGSKGILALIIAPPEKDDLLNLLKYRTMIMEMLGKTTEVLPLPLR